MVIINFEKADDTISRDLIWYCLKRKNVPGAFIDIIKDSTTVEKVGMIEIKISLHQGSTLNPLMFIIIMDFCLL